MMLLIGCQEFIAFNMQWVGRVEFSEFTIKYDWYLIMIFDNELWHN